ncbi:helix-turn-helix domain-containing protein [Streptococcus gordonii]|uniref:helix-turn-helix domain-containing protein n=1 Tax=Streptococcus gordonii TaxID=1302 RepID=UPI000DA34ACC|nr:XRE family transcriptional regulator [Streptococcus gordonii]QXA19187.1 helix-turn-helix domain-containing protein [Streptococcus gordonii]SQG04777.1 Cro/CI family transcriptional regulator [Streptococcus gordonii]
MEFKEELGQKIQSLREEKGLSRQAICGVEDILTTRQLQRIEKGQSLPTIATALYIAEQLEVSLDRLANRERFELPSGYLELKYRLEKLYHYGDGERLQQREELIEEIYRKYFDQLPEEEQLYLQIKQAKNDMILTENIAYDQGLIDEYLDQALAKEKLTEMDLEIIDLRLLALGLKDFDKKEFTYLLNKLLEAVADYPTSGLEKIQTRIIFVAGVLSHYQEYDRLPEILRVLEELMLRRNDFQDRVFSYALQWKIALFLENNLEKAEDNYQKVKLMLELLPEDVLKENMRLDWEQDIRRYSKIDE